MLKFKNIIILLSVFILLISISVNVFALSFSGEELCRCKEFCEAEMKCYFGTCLEVELETLNCKNGLVIATECNEPDYEICPACDILEECLDEDGYFLTDGICPDYYDFLVLRKDCRQSINFNVYWDNSITNGPLNNPTIVLGSAVEGVDYKYIFELDNQEVRGNSDNFSIPVCNKQEEIKIIAAKQGYDADIKEVTLLNDESGGIIELDFNLPIGTCHVDCTDSNDRCNPDCEGFTNGTDTCNFPDGSAYGKDVTQLCAYKPVGTEVILNTSADTYTVVDCCEADAGEITIFRPNSNVNLVNDANIVSVAKQVKIGDTDQGQLYLYYWIPIEK